jgi:hypothetical protein
MVVIRFLFALLLGFVIGAGTTLWLVHSDAGDLVIRRTEVVQDLERRLREVEEQRDKLGRQADDFARRFERMEAPSANSRNDRGQAANASGAPRAGARRRREAGRAALTARAEHLWPKFVQSRKSRSSWRSRHGRARAIDAPRGPCADLQPDRAPTKRWHNASCA